MSETKSHPQRVHKFLTEDLTVRAAAVVATQVVDEMRSVQNSYPIATVAVGLINDPNDAEMILETGEADLIAFARGALEDPNWAIHAHHALDGGEYNLWPVQARERIRSKDRVLGIRQ